MSKLFNAALCSVLLCGSAASSDIFGSVAKFNLVTMSKGDSLSCANSHVRGRVAAHGDTSLLNYNVACQANLETNPDLDGKQHARDVTDASDQCPDFGSWTCADLEDAGYADGSAAYNGLIAASLECSIRVQNAQVSGGISWGNDSTLR